MVTVKISIKKHLEEYMRGKFNDCREGVITLPDKTDLYHTLFDLTSKRPASCPGARNAGNSFAGQTMWKRSGLLQLS